MMKNKKQKMSAWRGTPLGELLGGTAFRPHPMDASLPLCARFSGQTILLVLVAKDRAACLRVLLGAGEPEVLGVAVQVCLRQAGDLAACLRREALEAGASWVVFSIATGWQAFVSSRAARAFAQDDEFEGHRVLREQPEMFLPKCQAGFLFAAVDHPTLDKSLVFGVRRREVDLLLGEAQAAGLGVAGVRLGVASLLEHALFNGGEGLLMRDFLVSDGLSVLLLRLKDADFFRDGSGEGPSMPRQASSRPNDVGQDLERFIKDNGARPFSFLGQTELVDQVLALAEAQGAEVVVEYAGRPVRPELAAFSDKVRHELLPDLSKKREALDPRLKPVLSGVLLVAALGFFVFIGATGFAEALDSKTDQQRARVAAAEQRSALVSRKQEALAHDLLKAEHLVQWLGTHPHGQKFLLSLLKALPASVTLERVSFQLDEGGQQLLLECHLLGMEDAQAEAVRLLEAALAGLGYRIGERHPPSQIQRGLLYKWRLIMPVHPEGGRL